jgi:hypothetical protein
MISASETTIDFPTRAASGRRPRLVRDKKEPPTKRRRMITRFYNPSLGITGKFATDSNAHLGA